MGVIETTIGPLLANLKQLTPPILLAVAVASGFALFSGDDLAIQLGLKELRNQYRSYLGVAFVGALSLLLAQGAFYAAREGRKRWLRRRLWAFRRNDLHDLTPEEQAYLAPYIALNLNKQYFHLEDGVVGGLEARKIFYRASSLGSARQGFAYNIEPWAKKYLMENPHLLASVLPLEESPAAE